MIATILLVLITFSVLVIAHEWGHFIAARRNGVKVDEFGIGFPPRLFGRKSSKGTLFSINLFPIGGFVRLRGEDGEAKGPSSFASKSAWVKTKILMAGVTMNFLIAYVIITFLLIVGMPPLFSASLPKVGQIQPQSAGSAQFTVLNVVKDSAAAQAGMQTADIFLSINGEQITSAAQLQSFTKAHAGQTVEVSYKHAGNVQTKQVTLGTDAQKGILGLAADNLQNYRYAWWAAPIVALVMMFQMIIASISAFVGLIVGLFTKAQVGEQVAGPVGIVAIFSQLIRFGWRYILAFMASISLSLAVINALPLPALDGGRELLVLLRRAGVRITHNRENLVHIIGFVALIVLMVIVSLSDISRLR